MKRYVHATTAKNVDRIEIDFYNYNIEEEIEAAKRNQRRVFKNTQIVMRDVVAYLEGKGLEILDKHESNNEGSDSTYYDIDLKVANKYGDIEFLYLRISDHHENPLTDEGRKNFHDRRTRQYKHLPDSADVEGMYVYAPILVEGRAYSDYSKALNYVKHEIDETLYYLERGGKLE